VAADAWSPLRLLPVALGPARLHCALGMRDMKTCIAIVVVALLSWAIRSEEMRREPRMTLPERVAGSTLIAVGKFGPPGNTGKLTTTPIRVEEVLIGSVPSGKTLIVSYTSSLWLIPEVAAYPGPVAKPGSRWIFFLTDADVKQVAGTNYYTRAVGPHKYAHDGFELAGDEVLKQVRELIARTRK
jgi:hypothetical protein